MLYTPQSNLRWHWQTVKRCVKDNHVESQLQRLTGGTLQSSTLTGNEVCIDICNWSFWQTSPVAFFDVRVFNPNTKIYVNEDISKTHELNEKE